MLSEPLPANKTVLKMLRPGDVVLMTGQSEIHRKARRALGDPVWTQLGLMLGSKGGAQRMLLASSDPVCADEHGNPIRRGVQTVHLATFARAFRGILSARRLGPPLEEHRITLLERLAASLDRRPFKSSTLEMARARARRNQQFDGASFYCSEIVAHLLQEVAVLRSPPEGRLPNNFLPDDFSVLHQSLELSRPFHFGPELPLGSDHGEKQPRGNGCPGTGDPGVGLKSSRKIRVRTYPPALLATRVLLGHARQHYR